jgi:hypothetical protein
MDAQDKDSKVAKTNLPPRFSNMQNASIPFRQRQRLLTRIVDLSHCETRIPLRLDKKERIGNPDSRRRAPIVPP